MNLWISHFGLQNVEYHCQIKHNSFWVRSGQHKCWVSTSHSATVLNSFVLVPKVRKLLILGKYEVSSVSSLFSYSFLIFLLSKLVLSFNHSFTLVQIQEINTSMISACLGVICLSSQIKTEDIEIWWQYFEQVASETTFHSCFLPNYWKGPTFPLKTKPPVSEIE